MQEGLLFVGCDCCPVYNVKEQRMGYKCCVFSHFVKNCNKNIKFSKCCGDYKINYCNISDISLFKYVNCISLGLSNINHAACNSFLLNRLGKFKADMFAIK